MYNIQRSTREREHRSTFHNVLLRFIFGLESQSRVSVLLPFLTFKSTTLSCVLTWIYVPDKPGPLFFFRKVTGLFGFVCLFGFSRSYLVLNLRYKLIIIPRFFYVLRVSLSVRSFLHVFRSERPIPFTVESDLTYVFRDFLGLGREFRILPTEPSFVSRL